MKLIFTDPLQLTLLMVGAGVVALSAWGGWLYLQDRLIARGDPVHQGLGAESIRGNPKVFRETTDDQRNAAWHARFAEYLDDLERQFEELLGDMPRSEHEPLPAGYWPTEADEPVEPIEPLTIDPVTPLAVRAMLEHLKIDSPPPCYSWSTDQYPQVKRRRTPFDTTDKRRQRRLARRFGAKREPATT